MRVKIIGIIITIIIPAIAKGSSIEEILKCLKKNSNAIKDIQMEVVMSIDMPSGKKEQLMKFYAMGEDKMRVEIISPQRSVFITNGDKIYIEAGGKSFTYDRTKEGIRKNQNNLYFYNNNEAEALIKNSKTRIIYEDDKNCKIEIIPNKFDPFTQRIEMTIDKKRGVITKQLIYTPLGVVRMNMKYKEINGVWVTENMDMWVPLPGGKHSHIHAEYKNIKLNRGLKRTLFEIKAKSDEIKGF